MPIVRTAHPDGSSQIEEFNAWFNPRIYKDQRRKRSNTCLLCQAVIIGAWIVITWRLIMFIHRYVFHVYTFFTHIQWRPTLNSVLILICEAVGLASALIFARSVRMQPHKGLYVHICALKNIYYVVHHKGVFRRVCWYLNPGLLNTKQDCYPLAVFRIKHIILCAWS
jgi:hypothetical protein